MGRIETYPNHKETSDNKWSKNSVFSVKNSTEMTYHKIWETTPDPHVATEEPEEPEEPGT